MVTRKYFLTGKCSRCYREHEMQFSKSEFEEIIKNGEPFGLGCLRCGHGVTLTAPSRTLHVSCSEPDDDGTQIYSFYCPACGRLAKVPVKMKPSDGLKCPRCGEMIGKGPGGFVALG